jgi:hypothetical protein
MVDFGEKQIPTVKRRQFNRLRISFSGEYSVQIWLYNTQLNMGAGWTVVPDSCCTSIPCHLVTVVSTSSALK